MATPPRDGGPVRAHTGRINPNLERPSRLDLLLPSSDHRRRIDECVEVGADEGFARVQGIFLYEQLADLGDLHPPPGDLLRVEFMQVREKLLFAGHLEVGIYRAAILGIERPRQKHGFEL
jgi:hypothetical protein